MKQRLPFVAVVLMLPSLLSACAADRSSSFAASSAATSHAAVISARPAAIVTDLRGFYRSYVAARKIGPRAVQTVVRGHVATWYVPILEAPSMAGVDPVACGLQGSVADWSFEQAGVWAGQAVIVIGSRPPGAVQELWIVATAVPASGKITGITCAIGGVGEVTVTGARDAVMSLYQGYVTARHQGASPQGAIAQITLGGPEMGNPYLQQVSDAITRQRLGYDPVMCATTGIHDASAGTTTVVAGSSVGIVVVSSHRPQFLVSVILGAKGWAVGDIACLR